MLSGWLRSEDEARSSGGAVMIQIPGMAHIGDVCHPHVNGGQALPVFMPVSPKDRPDINTLEVWTDLANKHNSMAFRYVFGRDPSCIGELRAWEESHFATDFRWGAEHEN